MAAYRLARREFPQYAKAALQSLARGVTIPCRLRLALAYWGGSEVRKIRWNGVLKPRANEETLMSVGEICNRDVIVVGKDSPTQEAIMLMREYHVGDVVVVEQRNGVNYPVGIITDRDIVIELLAEDVPIDSVTVGDIMSYELLSVTEEDSIETAINLMRKKGVRRLPVVNEDGALEGILTLDDLIDLIAEQMKDLAGLITKEQKREKKTR
jgi:CBS domain-containing protein